MNSDVYNENISDELLGCFVDNELDAEEHQIILQAQLKYPSIQKRVCEMRQLKQLVHLARPETGSSEKKIIPPSLCSMNKLYLAAAAIILILSGALFNSMYQYGEQNIAQKNHFAYTNPNLQTVMNASTTSEQTNIVIHINKKNTYNMDTILADIKNALQESRISNTPMRIEVVTSGPGLYLLGALKKHNLKTINKLYAQFGNVSFVVCQKTLNIFRDKTHQLNDIPAAMVLTASATDFIKLRQAQGWKYVPI